MALVWHEKASRTALQTSSVLHTHTLLVQTHNMTTVKEIAEQCRLRCSAPGPSPNKPQRSAQKLS